MARSFHKNKKPRDRFTVEIESLDQDGRGVAHREGKAVFVEGALPRRLRSDALWNCITRGRCA